MTKNNQRLQGGDVAKFFLNALAGFSPVIKVALAAQQDKALAAMSAYHDKLKLQTRDEIESWWRDFFAAHKEIDTFEKFVSVLKGNG